jgi:hypothetical protein
MADVDFSETPEVDPSTFSEGGGVTDDGVCRERKRSREEWGLLRQEEKRARTTVATPDALYNGLLALGFECASLTRLRTESIPKLGLDPMASWKSVSLALFTLGYPFVIEEATSRFQGGPPMLHLLRTTSGVFLVGLLVEIEGKKSTHCIAFSASLGRLIDNGSKTLPVYIEDKDRRGKKAARDAFRLLVGKKVPKGMQYSVDITDVYELKAAVRRDPEAPCR